MPTETKQLESIVAEKPQLDETRVYHYTGETVKWLGKPQPDSLAEMEKGIGCLIKDLFKGLKSEDPNVREEKLNELHYFKNLATVYFPKDNRFYRILTTMWDAYGNELSEGL
jgi:wobble nucleotide-excising tRNase